MQNLQIRNAILSDAHPLAIIHRTAFDESHFTANFSSALLTEYFKNIIRKMPYKLVAVDEKENIAGYLFAGRNVETIIHGFLHENFLHVLLYLILNPKFIIEKSRELAEKLFLKAVKSEDNVSLYLFAVNTPFRKKGVGVQLLNYFEIELKDSNEKSYGLSVRKSNKAAIYFYKKLGFQSSGSSSQSIKFHKIIQ